MVVTKPLKDLLQYFSELGMRVSSSISCLHQGNELAELLQTALV